MDHDGMFKQLLRTFFVDFLELFVPRVLEDLDQSSIEFIDKEIITDVAARERHEVDLLVKARFRGRESFFLIHWRRRRRRRRISRGGCFNTSPGCLSSISFRSIRS